MKCKKAWKTKHYKDIGKIEILDCSKCPSLYKCEKDEAIAFIASKEAEKYLKSYKERR